MNPFTESTVAAPLNTSLRKALFRSGVCLVLLGSAYANTAHAVDVNAANAAQLEAVRGIGPKTARVIVEERVRGGRFESFEDLSDRVKGIGPSKVATLKSAGLTVQGGSSVLAAGGKDPDPASSTAPGRGSNKGGSSRK